MMGVRSLFAYGFFVWDIMSLHRVFDKAQKYVEALGEHMV